MKSRNAISILFVISAIFVSCTDLYFYEYADIQPGAGPTNADPVVSIRAEQSPYNVWKLTFTYDENGSAEKDVYVLAPDGVKKLDLAFSVGKSNFFDGDNVGFVIVFLRAQLKNTFVHHSAQLLAASENDKPEVSVIVWFHSPKTSSVKYLFVVFLFMYILIPARPKVNSLITQITRGFYIKMTKTIKIRHFKTYI